MAHFFSDFEYGRQRDDPPPPLARIPLLAKRHGKDGGGGGGGDGGGAKDTSHPMMMTWGDALVKQIHHHGFAIVELPDETAAEVAAGLTAARAFFAQPDGQKRRSMSSSSSSGATTTSEGVYSAAVGGVHECLEIKRRSKNNNNASTSASDQHQHQQRGASTRTTLRAMYDAMDDIARACLADVERGLMLPPNRAGRVLSLLDNEPRRRRQQQPPQQRQQQQLPTTTDHDNDHDHDGGGGGGGGGGESLTAMRLLHYYRVGTLSPAAAQAMLGEHTDSSLLTVAPRSTSSGLEVAAYRRGPRAGWLDVEARASDHSHHILIPSRLDSSVLWFTTCH